MAEPHPPMVETRATDFEEICRKLLADKFEKKEVDELCANFTVGLDRNNTGNMVINLELYRGALDKCNQTINVYNGTIK